MAFINTYSAHEGLQIGWFGANHSFLSASDEVAFNPTKRQLLVIANFTGTAKTVVIDGTAGTTVAVPGIGAVSVAGGYSFGLADGNAMAVFLETIHHYCQGTVNVTGAAGCIAHIFEMHR